MSGQRDAVVRLVTRVELDGRPTRGELSVSARLEAATADGRRFVLLDDRGWTSSMIGGGDVARWTTAEEIAETARTVVGPDEPYGEETREQAESGHWSALAETLRRSGVEADPDRLARLPHEVLLGPELRARLG